MKTFFIRTYGCQMNELDSQVMAGILLKRGLALTKNENEADLIIFNTCSIRDLAERKVMGKIGIISRKKKKAIIGIAGCMPMLKKENLLKKFPYVDFILGTNNISDLDKVLDDLEKSKIQINKTDEILKEEPNYSVANRPDKTKAFVSIIRGCNNFCSYCVVPYTRGREVSRDLNSIIDEVQTLADNGCKEITLLGQNVNSYGKDKQELNILFPDLLYHLDKINGIKRIRFLTSHPKDITENLMYAIRDLPSVCEFLHFPAQSGSSTILKKMNRKYTIEDYLEKVDKIKKLIPNATLGTDIIVGFPDETEEDFQKTCDLFTRVRFSLAYIFAYSPRKNTPAYKMEDNISQEIKNKRLNLLLSIYDQILKEESQKMLNTKTEVLVERFNKDQNLLKGKTRCFRKVIFPGTKDMIGTLQQVTLNDYKHQTFLGTISN